MAISVTCPGCQTSYPVTEDLLGKSIRCKKCQETFTARAARSAVAAGRGDDRIQKAGPRAERIVDDDEFEPVNGTARARAPKPANGNNNTALIVGGSIAGVTILGLVGALIWVLMDRADPQPTPGPAPLPIARTSTPAPPAPTPPITDIKPTDGDKPADAKPADAKMAAPADVSKPADAKPADAKSPTAQLVTSSQILGGVRMARPANFKPEIVERVKKSAVIIYCVFEQGGAFGSGWVAEKNGNERYIVTNAHVVGMKERQKPPPDKIEITFDSGTPNSRTLEGKLLALDREEDLAVIRVKGPDLPEPLQIAPSFDLMDTQKLLIVGFPFGGSLKELIRQGLGVEVTTTVKTRESTVNGRYYNSDGSVKYIGVEGGADPGNSGGAAVDTNGHVSAVLVAGDPRSNLRMVIPSEYVSHLLAGRILRVYPGQAVKSGSTIKQPIRAFIADPMKRIRSVSVDVWPGLPAEKGVKIRSASATPPQPQEGDGPHTTATLNYNPDEPVKIGEPLPASGELELPPLKAGEVYWFQPHYIAKDGKERWGEAIMLEMGRHPVEAKPAMITVKHTPDVKPDDLRKVHIVSRQSQGAEIEELGGLGGSDLALRADLTERIQLVDRRTGEATVKLQYADMHLQDPERDLQLRKQFPGAFEAVKSLSAQILLTRDGKFRSPTTDWAQVPRGARGVLGRFNSQVLETLETLSLALPNKELQPGDTWSVETPYTMTLNLGPGNVKTENALFRTTCKFIGTRERNGREEAVVELTGTVVRNENPGSGAGSDVGALGGKSGAVGGAGNAGGGDEVDEEGRRKRGVSGLSRGSAVIDLATGLVTIARTESDIVVTTQISAKTPRGEDVPLTLHLGFYLDAILQRGLTKAPFEPLKDPSVLLPNMTRVYNPLVGVGEPLSADLPSANSSASVVPEITTNLRPEVMKKVQKAAVRIDVEREDGIGGGSGWFAEPGLVVTNCHVVGMDSKSARKPVKLTVVIDSGTANERKLDGKLLAIDRKEDLAVIKVEGDNLPEPMKILPTDTLELSSRLTVLGFPFHMQLADGLFQGLGVRDLKTTLRTRTTVVSDRIMDSDRNLKYIQYEGGGDPGNSGSAVVDANGNVRCIHVASLPDPRMPGKKMQMKFGIPSEYAARMLQGFPMEIEPEYAYLDGSTARQPIRIHFADPVRRVGKAQVDVWVGANGKARKPSDSLPKAAPGDSVRQTFDLKLEVDHSGLFVDAVGEFPLPPRSAGQVYWLQPRFVNGTGKETWGRAEPYSPDGPPVERRSIVLQHKMPKLGTQRTLDLTSEAVFRWQQLEEMHAEGHPLKATVIEQFLPPRMGLTRVQFAYKDLIWDLPLRGGNPQAVSEIRRLLKQFTDLIKGVVTEMTVTKEGLYKSPVTDYSRVPFAGLPFTKAFNDQLMQSFVAMSVPFPNKEIPYGHTWKQPTNLFIETRNRYQASLFNMDFKYLGVRDRGGRQEAVIQINGSLAKNDKVKSIEEKELKAEQPGGAAPGTPPQPPAGEPNKPSKDQYVRRPGKESRAMYGVAKGHAYIDVQGGYVAEVKLFIDVDVEMTVKDPETKTELPVPAGGTMEVLLKRQASAGNR